MGSGSDIRAGRAFVELATKGLDKVSADLSKLGKSLVNMGKWVSAGATAVTVVWAEAAKQIELASKRTGIGVEELSRLSYAARKSGVEAEKLTGSIAKMQKFLYAAAGGGKEEADTLRNLGTSVAELSALSPDQQFRLFADRIASIHDPATRTALAMQVFGKSAAELMPLLAKGGAGIGALGDKAKHVWTGGELAAAKAYRQAMGEAGDASKRLGMTVATAVAPVLIQFLKHTTALVEHVIKWARENQQLIASGVKLAATFVAVGGAVVTVSKAVALLSVALKALGKGNPLGWMVTAGAAGYQAGRWIARQVGLEHDPNASYKTATNKGNKYSEGVRAKAAAQAEASDLERRAAEAAEKHRYDVAVREGGNLRRVMADGILDHFQRAQKLIDLEYRERVLAARRAGEDTELIEQAWGAKLANLEAERLRARRDQVQQIEMITLQGIESTYARNLALINAEYDYKVKQAREANQDITLIERERAARIANVEQEHTRERRDRMQANADVIAENEIKLSNRTEREKNRELLLLRHKREMDKLGPGTLAAEEEMLRRKQATELALFDKAPGISRLAGTFSGAAAGMMGGSGGGVQAIVNRLGEHRQLLRDIADNTRDNRMRFTA